MFREVRSLAREGFQLPGHACRLLQRISGHPRDVRIDFLPGPHVYKVDGEPTLGSVTGLVHHFVEEFNADVVIAKMMGGHSWPREGYLRPDGAPMTPLEIKDKWEQNRLEAANRGTWMHFLFELYLNRVYIPCDSVEVQLFLRFTSTLTGYIAFRTEWEIFGEEERLAGSIDFVAEGVDRKLMIVDWKRTKVLKSKYSNSFRRMKPPFAHLPDCAGVHYRLQLNCYRFLIEKYYGRQVGRMVVVGTHPDNGSSPFLDEVPVLDAEVESLMAWQRSRAISLTS